jgi:hypothetical protein
VLDSITLGETIGIDNGTWRRRVRFFDAVEDESMCEIQRCQKSERQSLGVFRPLEVKDLKVTAAEEGFAESQRALLNQASLFGDRAGDTTRAALEPLPVRRNSRIGARIQRAPDTIGDSSTGSWERSTGDWLVRATMKPRSTRRSARSSSSSTAAMTATRGSSRGACSGTRVPS